jgi:hypothetical protein
MNQTDPPGSAWSFFAVLTSTLICWIILFWAMGKGYDFTDDAHYLIWVSDPYIYDWSVSEFGFLWNPIYRLVGGDIKLFRLAGAAVLSGSAAIFGWALYCFAAPLLRRSDGPTLVLAIVTASLWQFVYWLPTPGYNQLNLCGLLLFLAGLGFAVRPAGPSISEAKDNFVTIASAMLTAFGWCIVAFAKPPTATLILFVGIAWLILLRPRRPFLFVSSAVLCSAAFFVIGIWAIDGDIPRFVQRMITGIHMLGVHSPTHGFDAIWHSLIDPLRGISPQLLRLSIVLGVTVWWLSALLRPRRPWTAIFLTLANASALAVTVAIWRAGGDPRNSYYSSLLVPALLPVALGLALVLNGWRIEERWRPVAMAVMLALVPGVYAVATAAPVIYAASQAAVFLFSALIILATAVPTNRRARIFAAATMASSFMTVGMLIGAMATPYRISSPLWRQTERVEIGALASPLLVQRSAAEYIRTLQQAAAANGFRFGTPVIDLTGAYPGTVFALGGEAPGIPWLSGGYSGSTEYVRETLSRVPFEHLRQAWVLTAPDDSGTLPDSILRSLGLNFPEDYEMTGHACPDVPCVEHFLWKPKTQ